MRVALYARVSTEDKGQDTEVQLVPMRELVAVRGWLVVDEYEDFASARDLRGRRRWRRLLEDARHHRFDAVLVWKLDRFARSALDALQWLQQLDGHGIGLKILTQDIDTTTPAGRLVFTILAAVAEMERETIRERVRAGMELARSQGKHVGRPRRASPVREHPRFGEVAELVSGGVLTMREGARRLKVREQTLRSELRDRVAARIELPGTEGVAQAGCEPSRMHNEAVRHS
jgi:DNA invertase Pin-like site-specific DNA recombinase